MPLTKNPSPKLLQAASLFSGCGGLDLGISRAGFEIAWANEIDADSAESYRSLLLHDIVTGDVLECLNQIPPVDLLFGGPPCQSFSLVGRRSVDDPRGQLVFAFVESVKRSNPMAFVMENVRGILSSTISGKRLIDYVGRLFEELGYEISIVEVNAADYFVPQLRRRVFLIGSKTGKQFSLIDPVSFQQTIGIETFQPRVSVREALGDLRPPSVNWDAKLPYRHEPKSQFTKFIRSPNAKSVTLQVALKMSNLDREYVNHIKPGGNYRDIPVEIASPRVLRIMGTGGRTTTYARLHPDRPSYTVNTYFNRPNVGSNYHYSQKRLITPREALRLQSFPDSFSPTFSNQRSLFKQIGNAVPPNLGQLIGLSLKESVFS